MPSLRHLPTVQIMQPNKIIYLLLAVFLISAAIFAIAAETHGRASLLVDQSGREVLIPDSPVRVVSLAPSITEIIFALQEGSRLKGVTQHCDFPPEVQSLPRIGSYVHPDLEKIVALKPDLCIATKDGNPQEVVDRLSALNIAVYVVNPRNLNTIMDTILEIGSLLKADEKARLLTNDMRSRIDKVKLRVSSSARRLGVFFQIGITPIVSVGTNTFIHELITTAGGRNLAEGTTNYPRFSREQVVTLKPDVIIISSMTRGQVFEKVKAEWNRWGNMPAVVNQRIFIVDSNILDRPTPRLVEGLEMLVRFIHPELK